MCVHWKNQSFSQCVFFFLLFALPEPIREMFTFVISFFCCCVMSKPIQKLGLFLPPSFRFVFDLFFLFTILSFCANLSKTQYNCIEDKMIWNAEKKGEFTQSLLLECNLCNKIHHYLSIINTHRSTWIARNSLRFRGKWT